MPFQAFAHSEGDRCDYTPGSAVSAGDVIVQGNLVGVATTDIAANTIGSIALEGTFEIKKTASLAVAAGDLVYWDDTNKEANKTSSGNKLIGRALLASATSSNVVYVKLSN